MRRFLLLTAIVSASFPGIGRASEPEDERRDESADAQRGPQTAAAEWGVELFARGGLAGLTANGDVVWEGTVFAVPQPFTGQLNFEASNDGHGAAGFGRCGDAGVSKHNTCESGARCFSPAA